MKLYLDLGNSRTKWCVDDGKSTHFGACSNGQWERLKSDIGNHSTGSPAEIVVASVAGEEIKNQLITWSQENYRLTPVFARVEKTLVGVTACYENLSHLGVDRWLGMLAAYSEYRNACVVISAGTALTIDYLATDGRHLGGVIAPGLEMMRRALSSGTSNVKPESLTLPQTWAPGCDTVPCVQAGIAGAIQGLLGKALNHTPQGCYPQCSDSVSADGRHSRAVIVTGGDGNVIAPWCDGPVHIREHLVLEGLRLWHLSRPYPT